MKIIAIWDRRKVAPESKSTFCLLEDQRLLRLAPESEFQGTTPDGKRIYTDTGRPDYSSAFDENDRFDFQKADYFIKHFGGELIVRFQ